MAQICENCKKGIGRGNMVSHAKNRLKRIFKPNLQKIKAYRGFPRISVKLCAKCIKRLRRDKILGGLRMTKPILKKPQKKAEVIKPDEKISQKVKNEEKAKETLKIEDIVGKK